LLTQPTPVFHLNQSSALPIVEEVNIVIMKPARRIMLFACFLYAVSDTCTGTVKKTAPTGIYNPGPAHLWNWLYGGLFMRSHGKDGLKYGQDTVVPLLWPNTRQFLLSGPSHKAAIGIINESRASGDEKLVKNPLKRAIGQHDLAAMFEWRTDLDSDYGKLNSAARDVKLDAAHREIRKRLHAAIQRLVLDAKETVTLPMRALRKSLRLFSTTMDHTHRHEWGLTLA